MLETTTRRNSEEIDLRDVSSKLVARWKLLVLVTIIGAAVAFGVSKQLPKTYESKATIFVQQNSMTASLFRDLPMGLGSSSSGTSGYLLTLLQSERMLRDVVRRLNLTALSQYGTDLEPALRRLRETVFVADDKNGGIGITVKSTSPKLAADIANAMLDNLGNVVTTSSKRKAIFIAKKLRETDLALRDAERKLEVFQETSEIASVQEETKGVIDQLIDIDGRLLQSNMELRQVESDLANSGELNALVDTEVHKKSVEASRDVLAEKQRKLQKRLSMLPAKAVRYARLERRIGVLSKTYELLTEQYQLASISQHGEDGDYQIVDRASPKMKPVSPRVMLNTGIGAMLSFLAAAFLIANSGKSGYGKRKAAANAHE